MTKKKNGVLLMLMTRAIKDLISSQHEGQVGKVSFEAVLEKTLESCGPQDRS